jgi:hypothetical protein
MHFDQPILVAGHSPPSAAHPVEALADLAEHLQPRLPVAAASPCPCPLGSQTQSGAMRCA